MKYLVSNLYFLTYKRIFKVREELDEKEVKLNQYKKRIADMKAEKEPLTKEYGKLQEDQAEINGMRSKQSNI